MGLLDFCQRRLIVGFKDDHGVYWKWHGVGRGEQSHILRNAIVCHNEVLCSQAFHRLAVLRGDRNRYQHLRRARLEARVLRSQA